MDELFSFGKYELSPHSRVLLREGSPVSIGSRAFDMLVAMVRRNGDVLSKKELNDIAWAGVFVEDSNIRVQMAALRRELGCGQNGDRYIVSIPGRGYCFVAPVMQISNEPELDPARPPEAVAPIALDARRIETVGSSSRLPAVLESAYGRDDDIAALLRTIRSRRFVTVIGPGGVGKTTLAVLIAHNCRTSHQNVHFVDLSGVVNDHSVEEAVAISLGLGPAIADMEHLVGFLKDRSVLIVMDNCEHVINGVSQVIESVLAAAPNVQVLATSREALRSHGEAIYIVRSLQAPRPTESLTAKAALDWPAVKLFMERAAEGGYDLELKDEQAQTVAAVCRRLDGNPLAIELVATRVASYGLERIAELLTNQLILRWRWRRSAVPRHQTVEAMIDWSHDLLSSQDQKVLRRLSVFVGDFSIEAAAAVVADEEITAAEAAEAMGNLIDKSLIAFQTREGAAQLRLRDTMKAYANMKLNASDDASTVRRSHAQYYLRQLREYPSAAPSWLNGRAERANLDVGNIRAALEWAFSAEGDKRLAVELSGLAIPAVLEFVSSARRRTAV